MTLALFINVLIIIIIIIYNRLHTIPACDRQTDRQTSCHGIVRAMDTHRAVKILLLVFALAVLQVPVSYQYQY